MTCQPKKIIFSYLSNKPENILESKIIQIDMT